MLRVAFLLIVLTMLIAGCRGIPVAGECPESQNLRCMGRKICTEDKKRGCMVCSCEQIWESDPTKADERIRGRSLD